MQVTVDLSVTDLAGTRFAVSPLAETIAGLQQLGGLGRRPATASWLRWARAELDRRPLGLPRSWPLLVHDRPSWPQFLLPAPTGAGLDGDLAALRATAAEDVRASLRRVFGAELPPAAAELAADPAAGLAAIAGELRTAYERLVGPYWARIGAVLAADIAHRARQLAAGGAELLFADLHPQLRFRAGRLTVGSGRGRSIGPGAGGLVLVPFVLGPDAVLVKGHTTTRTTLRYPARGTGELWSAGTRPVPRSAVRLLGRPRAELLEALRSPATTTDLARALGVTPSAVSQHLGVLRASRLVAGERVGRTVLYAATERGRQLLDP